MSEVTGPLETVNFYAKHNQKRIKFEVSVDYIVGILEFSWIGLRA